MEEEWGGTICLIGISELDEEILKVDGALEEDLVGIEVEPIPNTFSNNNLFRHKYLD
jgi:hypothetical protein